MKILVVGGGGREHAIITKIKENPDVSEIFAIPGNGGISYDAECIDSVDVKDIKGIVNEKAPGNIVSCSVCKKCSYYDLCFI